MTITGVADPRFGAVASPSGLDPGALLAAAAETSSFEAIDGYGGTADVIETMDRADADVLVELTYTDLETGEPATTHMRHALGKGMSVSTTNKGPIALHLDELEQLAREHNAYLGYEGTVMSGTPALLVARETISRAGFRSATGILNGTTNYLITRMEEGAGFGEALIEAQNLGYAEADPSGDVGGRDVAAKLAILSRVLLGRTIPPGDVVTTALDELSAHDVRAAFESGKRWRYVGVLEETGGRWHASVAPRRLESPHPLASVVGAANALMFETDLLGEITIVGPGAGRTETAFSVVSDLHQISGKRHS